MEYMQKRTIDVGFCRLVGDSRVIDSASSGNTRVLCTHIERPLGWGTDMFDNWMLPFTRAHSCIWWLQKLSYSNPWNFQHSWHNPPTCLPCLGHGCSFLLALYNNSDPSHFFTLQLNLCKTEVKDFVTSLICSFLLRLFLPLFIYIHDQYKKLSYYCTYHCLSLSILLFLLLILFPNSTLICSR